MDRTISRRGRAVRGLLAGLLVCLPLAGCAKVLATAVYVIKGTNVEAEYDGLQEKRVAVVCRQLASLQ
jgi:hypothetical protein